MSKLKALYEKRNTCLENMEALLSKVAEETRAMDEGEQANFKGYQQEMADLDTTIEAQKYAEELAKKQNEANNKVNPTLGATTDPAEEKRMEAEKDFLAFVRNEDQRALDVAGNGGIIPQILSDRIIEKVKELSPIYQRATIFNVGGDLIFSKFDYTTIPVGYIADMTALTPANGNFTTVKLQNFIVGSLVQVSRSLMNRTDFDLVSFIVNQMAMAISDFIEKQLLTGVGTTAALGVFVDPAVTEVTAASATALAFDDMITTQMSVPEAFQSDACWIMNKAVFQVLRKVKDTTGQYMLSTEASPSQISGFGWTMLGKPVFVSENVAGVIATGNKVLVYGDMSGLYVKLSQQMEVQVLNELYATSHAVGIVGYVEFDSRVVETQKIVRLKMA